MNKDLFVKTDYFLKTFSLLIFMMVIVFSCKEKSKSVQKSSSESQLSPPDRSVGYIDERGVFKFNDSISFKTISENILKNDYNQVNLLNIQIVQDSTNDNYKEPYFKVIAEDISQGIKVVRWLKMKNGFFYYYVEADQKKINQDSYNLGTLVICQGCDEMCEPVLFKPEKSYYWSCEALKCEDCKKTQAIL